MNVTQSFGFIGGGRIVRIILEAMRRKNQFPAKIVVGDPNDEIVDNLVSTYQESQKPQIRMRLPRIGFSWLCTLRL